MIASPKLVSDEWHYGLIPSILCKCSYFDISGEYFVSQERDISVLFWTQIIIFFTFLANINLALRIRKIIRLKSLKLLYTELHAFYTGKENVREQLLKNYGAKYQKQYISYHCSYGGLQIMQNAIIIPLQKYSFILLLKLKVI